MPDSASSLNRRLLIVTGKGGVGKTTIAAAIAWNAAQLGRRVLACELDPTGDLAGALAGASGVGHNGRGTRYAPDELHPRLWVMAMDPEASLKEYLRLNLKIPFITKVGALSNAFDFLANAAPGVREIVTIGKVAWEVRERHYDLVVVDASASGHAVGLLQAPDAINSLVGAGMIRNQTAWMLDILHDPAKTGVVVVTTLEELPVSETLEVCGQLDANTGSEVAMVVTNRVLPSATSVAPERLQSGGVGVKAARSLSDASTIAASRYERQQAELQRLADALPASAAIHPVPMLFDTGPGLPVTRAVAEVLK